MEVKERQHAAARTDATWCVGRVVDVAPDGLCVSIDQRVHEASVAVGCLVEPLPGDEVCVLRGADGRMFVMTVLCRTKAAPLTVQAPHGLTVRAGGNIHIDTTQTMRLGGERLEGQFDDARWTVRLMQLTGVEFLLRSKTARLFAHAAEAVLGRLQLSADRSYRNIAEAEHLRTGMLDVRAERVANIRAGTVLLSARELTKVDGAQIHVG